jgi:hypothetical protein
LDGVRKAMEYVSIGAAINGVGFLLWIAGAIEKHLIEIRDRLPAAMQ